MTRSTEASQGAQSNKPYCTKTLCVLYFVFLKVETRFCDMFFCCGSGLNKDNFADVTI